MALVVCVCCLCIAPRGGCRPASGMSTPSRCRARVHSRCQWCRDRLWAHWFCEVVCVCVCVCVWQSRCVPFSNPHVHKVTPSGKTRQDATTAVQTHWDQSTIWRGHTTPTTSATKEKEGDTSTKGSVLILTCDPLPRLVLPLSGCACSGTPTMATRGEARGHPWYRRRRYQGCPLAEPEMHNWRWHIRVKT